MSDSFGFENRQYMPSKKLSAGRELPLSSWFVCAWIGVLNEVYPFADPLEAGLERGSVSLPVAFEMGAHIDHHHEEEGDAETE